MPTIDFYLQRMHTYMDDYAKRPMLHKPNPCKPPPPPSFNLQPPLPGPNLRPRARICSDRITIRIDGDARIALRRIPRNARQELSARLRGPTTRDLDLRTLGVELRGLGLVQREQLVAHEVVSWGQGFGNRGFPVQVLEHFGGAPGAAG